MNRLPAPARSEADPVTLPPCPFCEGPPSITVQRTFEPFGPVYREPSYGCGGIDINAYVFCHECGAQGPQHEDVIFDEADYLDAEAKGADLWTERTTKHRDLYDASAEEGLTTYPRKEQQA